MMKVSIVSWIEAVRRFIEIEMIICLIIMLIVSRIDSEIIWKMKLLSSIKLIINISGSGVLEGVKFIISRLMLFIIIKVRFVLQIIMVNDRLKIIFLVGDR
ncbi:MAG: hypothetical protein H9Q65_02795 [Spiroplasma ixodetis]|nr:hypothetical protein [Spiroplasma ixodetis]